MKIMKNKKLLEKILVDFLFYTFILIGLPLLYIISFVNKWPIELSSLIYAVLMILIITLKSLHDSNKLQKRFFKGKK